MQKRKNEHGSLFLMFVRFTFAGILANLVYGETGPFTTFSVLLILASLEVVYICVKADQRTTQAALGALNVLMEREKQRTMREMPTVSTSRNATLN